jgi:hypothetical protein
MVSLSFGVLQINIMNVEKRATGGEFYTYKYTTNFTNANLLT